ncbi:MAG: hypothetical protein ABR985_18025 [Methanotrichaceae archaeon]
MKLLKTESRQRLWDVRSQRPKGASATYCKNFEESKSNKEIAAVLTQVTVARMNPGFRILPSLSDRFILTTWKTIETRNQGWRRVVPSPKPMEIVEIHTIEDARRLPPL